MAYNTRTRDPLLEAQMQATIRKRGTEFLGLVFIVMAIVSAISLWTHSPNDPNFLNSTSGEIQNKMGVFGASYAGTFMLAIGWASWTFTLAFLAWGIRLVLHRGDQLLLRRGIFMPLFAAFAAVFMATNVPPETWPYSFSLGGFSGDAILEMLVDFNPIDLAIWVKVLSLLLGIVTIWLGLFSLGFSFHEVKSILQRGVYGLILAFDAVWNVIKKLTTVGAKTAKVSAVTAKEKYDARQKRKDGMPDIRTDEFMPEKGKTPKEMGRRTLFPTLPIFNTTEKTAATTIERTGDAAPVDDPREFMYEDGEVVQQTDRVTRRIQDAIHRQKLQSDNAAPMAVLDEEAEHDVIEPVAEFIAPAAPTPPAPAMPSATDDHDNIFDDGGAAPMNIFEDDTSELPLTPGRQEPTLSRPAAPKSVVEYPSTKPIPQSNQAKSEAQPTLFAEGAKDYEQPALNLLASPTTIVRAQLSDEALEENARMLENVLDDYGVKGEIVSVRPGPVVTMYELEPAPGLKASRVIGLADDIARSMSALAARVSTVPGRTVIGIELPNDHRETVLLREILSARDYGDGKHGLPLALGKDIGGVPEVADLAKMPHLLIAGTTGSGKSVAINTMILSLLYKLTPDECRLIMIDPKMLELSVYDGIPHLLSPVVTDPRKAVVALKWVVGEMEERYRKMSKMGVRNISGYNSRVADALAKGEDFERTVQTGFDDNTGEPIFETETFAPEKMPFIVVVVDEMADLMMVAGKEIEACIQRLAQMARASGIHLIMATQRPSVDVITGTIKANFPTRISFQVTSKIDSRTILGEMGAEQLLGMGDMLYMAGGGKITRIHAPFVSDEEVELIVNHLKTYGPPQYESGVVKESSDEKASNVDAVLGLGGNTGKENALYDQAIAIVANDRKCSTSYIQRKLSIGYNKAAKLVEEMEENGVVSAANHVGKREILLPEQN
jgi:S-DNA-T family DNA segregation ATPase FtsK/SpoIIIE